MRNSEMNWSRSSALFALFAAALIGVIGFSLLNHSNLAPKKAIPAHRPLPHENKQTRPEEPSPKEASPADQSVAAYDASLASRLANNQLNRADILIDWADTVKTRDMEQMLSRVETITDQELRTAIRQSLLTSWIRRDQSGIAAWFVKRNSIDQAHQETRELLAKNLCQQNPENGFYWMENTLPENVRKELYGPFFREWTDAAPAAAAAKLIQSAGMPHANQTVWHDLIGQMAARWANRDLTGARKWVITLPDGPIRNLALEQVVYRWVESDPAAAAAVATERRNNIGLLRIVATRWTETDPKAAAEWGARLSRTADRNEVQTNIAAAWAQKDPTNAAHYACSLPEGENRDKAILSVASTWAYADPLNAAKWIGQIPEGSVRERALEQLLSAWAGNNPDTASRWLKDLPVTSSRDAAVHSFSNAIRSSYPEEAFEWAGTISSEAKRNQSLEQVATDWLKKEPAKARKSISASRLPDSVKSRLLVLAAGS